MISFGDTRSLYDTHLAFFLISTSAPAHAIDIVHTSGSMELTLLAGRYAHSPIPKQHPRTLSNALLGIFLEMSTLRVHQRHQRRRCTIKRKLWSSIQLICNPRWLTSHSKISPHLHYPPFFCYQFPILFSPRQFPFINMIRRNPKTGHQNGKEGG